MLLVLLSTLLGSAMAACGCSHHVAVQGDSIYGTIAPKYPYTWVQICDCNGGNPACGSIKVGQKVSLPCPANSNTPKPTQSPTRSPTVATPKPTQSPTRSPVATPKPTQSPTRSPVVNGNKRVEPNLTGAMDRGYWKNLQTNKDGTYYKEWDPKKGGHSAVTRGKTQAIGACGISGVGSGKDALPAFAEGVMPIAVSNLIDYDGSLACGMCIEYIGTGVGKGSNPIDSKSWQKGIIVDACSGCKKGDIDLAKNGDGRWKVNWRAVDCAVGSSKFQYTFYSENGNGNHDWWVKMQIRNHKVPVYKVEMLDQAPKNPPKGKVYSNKFVEMTRTKDNHFMANSGKMTRPYSHQMKFRITSIWGEVVEEEIDTVNNAILKSLDFRKPVTGTVQFDGGSFGAAGSRRMVQTAPKNMQHRIGNVFAGL